MTEKELFSKKIKPQLNGVLLQRIESHGTGNGIPDVYFKTKNMTGWIELKVLKKLGEVNNPDWRAGQIGWLRQNKKLNEKGSYLLIYFEDVKKIAVLDYFNEYYSKDEIIDTALFFDESSKLKYFILSLT